MLGLDLINAKVNTNLTVPDAECWIPFEFKLIVEDQIFIYNKDDNACFTLYEIRNFIDKSVSQIALKRQGSIERYEFNCFECYYKMVIYDTLEIDQIYIDIWINMGEYTKGVVYGYDKGFRFVVDIGVFDQFINELRNQLDNIMASN